MTFSSRRALRVLFVSLVALSACGTAVVPGTNEPRESLLPPGEILWQADHETGDLSQWLVDQGEAVFNTGNGYVYVTHLVPSRSGKHALVLGIFDAFDGQVQAARIFRWAENAERAYYSVWLYFPNSYQPDEWWNVLQFKSPDTAGNPQPTWIVNVHGEEDGRMAFYLWDALKGVAYHQDSRVEIPVGEWVHVEIYCERATDESGRIALWQDGQLLFDLVGQQTAITESIHWSIDNYTDQIEPTEVLLYADDAMIRSVGEGAE